MPDDDASAPISRLDVWVSNDSFATLCEGALTVIRMVKNWKPDQIDFELFRDGITNHLLRAFVRGAPEEGSLLVRVYGERTELFIDRDQEVRNMRRMCGAGLCAPLHCAFANGLCYGYSPGEVLDTRSVRQPRVARLIAVRLARMHRAGAGGANGRAPSLFPVLHKYLRLVPDAFPDDPGKERRFRSCIPSRDALAAEVETLKEHLEPLGSPVVFAHNDLLLKNVIYNQQKDEVTFIDYEYADYNYQALDIGNHFCEFAGVERFEPELYPDREFQLRWLRDYLEAWSPPAADRDVLQLYVQVNKFALAAHLFWGVWALIQAAHSTLEFDFLGYAKERLDEYFARKDEFLSLSLEPNCHNGTAPR